MSRDDATQRGRHTRSWLIHRRRDTLLPMSRERFHERVDDVRRSAARLAEAVARPTDEIVRDATIQRFEFTFEVIWKTLKLHLEHQGHECGGPRATIKRAFAEKLIPTEADADGWLAMIEARNLTTHAYDPSLAQRIHQRIVEHHAPRLAAMADMIGALRWD